MLRTHKNKKNLYLNEVFGHEDIFLKQIKQLAEQEGVQRMQISSYEGRLLQFLVHISKAKYVVEIGTLYAYSTLHMARALPEGGKIFTLDVSSSRHKKSQEVLRHEKNYKKIQWICGPASDTLQTIGEFAPFDMVFIDADKEAYKKYLLWAEKHLKTGGIVVADNTFLFGSVYGESDTRSPKQETIEVMKDFNSYLSDSPRWEGALIPTEEGLSVGIKKI